MVDATGTELEMPGVGYDFFDVTNIFIQAGQELEPHNLLFMENFTLQESMSVLEIGEPRLDSGLIIEEQCKPPFNPVAPLLPEEVCWILDRALAYETEFHAGNFLAHTVHTLLYVHHLRDIDPDVAFISPASKSDPSRPLELLTIVLRAAVQGLLKCCDCTWRELAKGGAYDTEDWQSDKCEVSLLEGVPAPFIIKKLDEAVNWLSQSSQVPQRWRSALQGRLQLRKSLLQVMLADPFQDRLEFQNLIFLAKEHLHCIQIDQPPEVEPDSLAQLAFDPYIGRRLQMATPIRVVRPPTFQQTCKSLNHFLDGLHEIAILETVDNLTTWETIGYLRLWLPDPPLRTPYLRSRIQSTFYDGFLLMNKYSFDWMINRFFEETAGITYDLIKATITSRWTSGDEPPLKRLERSIHKLITPHIRALWHNPPRRRRHFMKSLVEWQNLYDTLVNIRDNLDVEGMPHGRLLAQLPNVALLWRLSIVREVVLSGFQLELYAKEERSFAYWYAAQVMEAHLQCLDSLLPMAQAGSSVQHEMSYQIQFLTALQCICTTSSLACMPSMSSDSARAYPNFFRRYKWAFRAEYDNFEHPVIAQPELHKFIHLYDVTSKTANPIPSDPIVLARSILRGLIESNNSGGWAGVWASDRIQFLRNLVSACDNLTHPPTTLKQTNGFNTCVLKWDPAVHPWFPSAS